MIVAETCPDCAARLPANSPAGLCPRCLLRLGAALSADPAGCLGLGGATDPVDRRDDGTGPLPPPPAPPDRSEAIEGGPRVHLRETAEDGAADPARSARDARASRARPSRYQLVGELARGGMGAIFQGRDLELGRDLAVKVIREEHRDDPEMVRRFVEEAQIGGQLQHPGIVPVHELGRLPDGRMFIAMKLVRGRTLAALLAARRGPDDDRMRFLSIFEQVCQTMAYAHARGVVHRDLKPSNIMVGTFGEVQVMDWGLAKVLDQGGIADEERAIRRERRPRRPDAAEPVGGDGIAAGLGARHAVVHGARAGPGRAGHARRARGRLRPRLDPLRDPHRRAGLRGRRRGRGVPQGGACRPLRGASPASTPATPTRSWWAWRASCLAAAPKHRPRDAGIVVTRADRLPPRRRGAAARGRAGPGEGGDPRRRGAQAPAVDARAGRVGARDRR